MNQSAIHWKQGFQLQAHHTEENNIRILLVGDSVIAGTEFIRNFHEHIEDVGSGKRCEIVKQITTEAMGWKFLLFLGMLPRVHPRVHPLGYKIRNLTRNRGNK